MLFLYETYAQKFSLAELKGSEEKRASQPYVRLTLQALDHWSNGL